MVHLKVFTTNTWQELETQFNEWEVEDDPYLVKTEYCVVTYVKSIGFGMVFSLCVFYKNQSEMEFRPNEKRTLKEASM